MRYPSAFESMTIVRERSELIRLIEKCYTHKLGPGVLPKLNKRGKRLIKGAVVPHAGYEYSGPVSAHVFNSIAGDGFPETFVILGGDHVGFSRAVATTENFVTPLGEVSVDKELAEKISLEENPDVHADEHAIGMQLPFLLHISPEIKLVPIYVPSGKLEVAKEAGKKIGNAIKGKDVVVLASSDFTHAGPSYGQLPPPGVGVDEFVKKQDERAIKAILNLSPDNLWSTVAKHEISMCGVGAVTCMLFALSGVAKSARLLKHASSHEIQAAPNAVGYAAIVIE